MHEAGEGGEWFADQVSAGGEQLPVERFPLRDGGGGCGAADGVEIGDVAVVPAQQQSSGVQALELRAVSSAPMASAAEDARQVQGGDVFVPGVRDDVEVRG